MIATRSRTRYGHRAGPYAGKSLTGKEAALAADFSLRRLLPPDRAQLPREVQQNIDMESYRIRQTSSGRIALERKAGVLDPVGAKNHHSVPPEEIEALSRIIEELNERFGLDLGPEHRVTLG